MKSSRINLFIFVGIILLSTLSVGLTVSDSDALSILLPTVETEDEKTYVGDTVNSRVSLTLAPQSGISSYNITVSVENESIADITGAEFPGVFGATDYTVHSNKNKIILNGAVILQEGDPGGKFAGENNITLSQIKLKGQKEGKSKLKIRVNSMRNGTGAEITTANSPGTLNVIDTIHENQSTGEKPSVILSKIYDGGENLDDVALSLYKTQDNGYILAGYTTERVAKVSDISPTDAWILKVDSNGNKEWSQKYGESGESEVAKSIIQVEGDQYVFAGKKESEDGDTDLWVQKIDSNGDKIISFTSGAGEKDDSLNTIDKTRDGGFMTAGYMAGHESDTNAVLIKFNSNLQTDNDENPEAEWVSIYKKDNRNETINSVKQTLGDRYVFAGKVKDLGNSLSSETSKAWLGKAGFKGEKKWSKKLRNGTANSVVIKDNKYIVSAEEEKLRLGGERNWLIKTDSDGNKIFETRLSRTSCVGTSLTKAESGFAIAGGSCSDAISRTGEGFDGWVVKTDSTSKEEWKKTLDDSGFAEARSIVKIKDGYAIAGSFSPPGTFGDEDSDFWLVELSEKSSTTGDKSKSLEFEATGGSVSPGKNVGVNFTLTNIGESLIDTAHIQIDTSNQPVPEGWEFEPGLNDGGTPWWNANLYWESPPLGSTETTEPSLLFSIPKDESTGKYELAFEAHIPTDSGLKSIVKDNATIEVKDETNKPPIPEDFEIIPENPNVGEQVTFDATGSTDPDGVIKSYRWEFGDGSTGTGKTVTHTYLNTGTYKVTLTVTDNDGAFDSLTKSVQVGDTNNNTTGGSHNLSVNVGTATPGGSVKIDISADNVGGISISKIPEGWSVKNTQDSGGIFTTNDPDNDGNIEQAGWAFPSVGDKSTSLTLNIPENTEKRDYQLTATVKNGDENTKTFTVTVGGSIVDQYDVNSNGSIEGDEVRNAINDFLFGGNISGKQVRKVIQTFLFG